MSLNRWRVNFEGNERVDLPDFRAMMARAFADFDLLVRTFIDNAVVPRVLKRYQQGVHTANVFKIVRDQSRAIMDKDQQWLSISPDSMGSTVDLAVGSGDTSYISVKILTTNDDLQTRAFWDTDVGLTGEEFFDEINVRTRLDEQFTVTTGAPASASLGWIPLFEVVTDGGGNVTSVTRIDDLFWKARSFSLPAPSLRSDVYESSLTDLRSFIDFLGALLSEVKGTGSAIESATWSNLKLLREYQNIFYTGGGLISWEIAAADTLRFTDKIFVKIAGRADTYELGITGNNDFVLADGECLYVDIPEGAGPTLTPVVAAIEDVPVNPTDVGFSPRIMVLFYREGGTIYGTLDIPEISSGETVVIGQDLPTDIRTRLGITSESTFEAYTSTFKILLGDSYATAISKLDAAINAEEIARAAGDSNLQSQINAIQNDRAKEEGFTVGVGGQSVFNVAGFTWDADQTVFDLVVRVNGVQVEMDPTGGFNRDYRKNSDSQIEFAYTVPENARVVIRQERTGGGGGGGSDLENINVDPKPDTNGARSLGAVTKAWQYLYLKDAATSQVYRFEIVNGVFNIEEVP